MSSSLQWQPARPVAAVLGLAVALGVALSFALSPFLALALALLVAVMGIALHRPWIATHAVLFLLYSNLPAVGVAFHGVPRPVAAAFPLLLLIPLAHDLLVRRLPVVITPTFALLLLLLAVQLAGATLARDAPHSLATTGTLALEGVLLYLLVVNVVRSPETLRGATWSLIAAGVLMAVVPLFQQATGTFENAYGGLAQVDSEFATGEAMEESAAERRQARLAGTIGEQNRYAQVMLVLLPLALSRLLAARGFLRLVALGCALSITLGFVLAFSRGGAIGLAGMVIAMMALRIVRAGKMLLVAAGLVLVLAAMPQYSKRLATIGTSVHAVLGEDSGAAAADGAVRRRLTSMLAAARVFLDHPVIGVGPGMFMDYSQEYGNEDALRRIEGGRRAHSLYLEIAAENGALGLGLFLAALGVTLGGLLAGRRICQSTDPEVADLCTAYLLALVCYLVTGMFLHLAYLRYFFVLLGLCGAAAEVARTSCEARAEGRT